MHAQTNKKQNQNYRERMTARRKGVGGDGQNGWRVKEGCRFPVIERVSHGNERFSIGHMVNSTVIALYGDK